MFEASSKPHSSWRWGKTDVGLKKALPTAHKLVKKQRVAPQAGRVSSVGGGD